MICTILGNLDVVIVWLDFVTELGSLDVFLYRYNDGNLDGLLFGGSLGSTDGKYIGSGE